MRFFAEHTANGGSLSFDAVRVAFAQSHAEYVTYRDYDREAQLTALTEKLSQRSALLQTMLNDIMPSAENAGR